MPISSPLNRERASIKERKRSRESTTTHTIMHTNNAGELSIHFVLSEVEGWGWGEGRSSYLHPTNYNNNNNSNSNNVHTNMRIYAYGSLSSLEECADAQINSTRRHKMNVEAATAAAEEVESGSERSEEEYCLSAAAIVVAVVVCMF